MQPGFDITKPHSARVYDYYLVLQSLFHVECPLVTCSVVGRDAPGVTLSDQIRRPGRPGQAMMAA